MPKDTQKMCFRHTPGAPDFEKMVKLKNPKFCTRARRKKPAHETKGHFHIENFHFKGATVVWEERDTVHNSNNVYYKLKAPVPANCAVLSCDDESIFWAYVENSARQSARPFKSGLDCGMTYFAKRCYDCKTGRVRTQHSIPKELVPKSKDDKPISGDLVARWNQIRAEYRFQKVEAPVNEEEERIIKQAVEGPWCVYPCD